jgi:hypothetical protein
VVEVPGSVTLRPVAEMMPSEAELDRPIGLPMASTIWPTCAFEESANVAAFKPDGGLSSLITARSPCGNVLTTFAGNVLLSVESVTV